VEHCSIARKGKGLMSRLKEKKMFEEDEDFPGDEDDPQQHSLS